MQHASVLTQTEPSLYNRFLALKEEEPKIRARNAARKLGVSEAELVASKVGLGTTKLNDQFEEMLTDIIHFGDVMALSRNEACVHERHGIYDNASFFNHGKIRNGLFVNPDIDLRLFINRWKFAFAVEEEARKDVRRSIQFFNADGLALHKVYLTHNSDESFWDTYVNKYKAESQDTELDISSEPEVKKPKTRKLVDWKEFRKAWEGLKDTHDFFPMLRRFKLDRYDALRNIGADFALEIETSAVRTALEAARDRKCEIMVFVGNPGAIQIHTGTVNKLVESGNWYNVLDPRFNLHIDLTLIDSAWITRKPTVDGIVTAIEFLDADKELVLTYFGKRKPGIPELTLWREIVADIEKGKI